MSKSPWKVPTSVVGAVHRRWTLGATWSQAVELELQDLCERFDAQPTAVFEARYSFVVAAESLGRQLVLRVSPDPDARMQARNSLALARLGAGPTVHEVSHTTTGTWTVMDRVVPGTPLDRVGNRPIQDALARLFRPLAGQSAPDQELPSIATWLRERLVSDTLADLPPGRTVAPPAEREAALSVLDNLGEPVGLCHGDASTGNVLTSGRNAFQLIDPRGFSGDVVYDIAVVVLKSGKFAPQQALIDSLTRSLRIDREQVLAWMAVANTARV